MSPFSSEQPALEPPPGVTPKFSDIGAKGMLGHALVILCVIFGSLALLTRAYSRFLISKAYVEDGFLAIAMCTFATHSYFAYSLATYPGYHAHQWNITIDGSKEIFYNTYVSNALYSVSMALIKPAILLDWLQLFLPHGQRSVHFWISHVLIWLNVAFYTSATFAGIFQCSPRAKFWDHTIAGHCEGNQHIRLIISGAINLFSDVAILVFPQTVIWKLQISRLKKSGVAILFGVGVFACVCAAMRLSLLNKTSETEDKIYYASEVALWANAEMTTGFLVMGVPSIPKVLKSLAYYDLIRAKVRARMPSKETQSRRGLPSWYNPERRNPRYSTLNATEIDETEIQPLQTVQLVHKPGLQRHGKV